MDQKVTVDVNEDGEPEVTVTLTVTAGEVNALRAWWQHGGPVDADVEAVLQRLGSMVAHLELG